MEIAVKLENVSKLFPSVDSSGKRVFLPALRSVSLEIAAGSVAVVAGANGSGKSVLMSVIAGLLKPSEGAVWTKSKPGLVFQDASAQILGDTPLEDVCFGLKNLGIKGAEMKKLAEKSLESVHLAQKAENRAEFLSGGEKRRLAVAAILALGREIIIFDEPYANLDYPAVVDVNNLISELKKQGKTIILLTHELEKCLKLSNHFVILSKGKIVFDGNSADALALDLKKWSIKNPLARYETLDDLVWL